MDTTQQVHKNKLNPPNPNGKGGFGENPHHRNPGGWDKTGSISYQYNLLMRLKPDELKDYEPTTVAQEIALARIKAARSSDKGLNDTKEVTDRTEGKAPQSMDITSGGERLPTVIIENNYGNKPNFRVDNSLTETDAMATDGNSESS